MNYDRHIIYHNNPYEKDVEEEVVEVFYSNCCGAEIIGEISDDVAICPECGEWCQVEVE